MTHSEMMHHELIELLCGDKIGSGLSRVVYDCAMKSGYVVKIEKEGYYQNIREWEVWQSIKETEHAKWFAECWALSPNGRILIMEKTRPPGLNEWPEKVPAFFTDIKRRNFGMSMIHEKGTGKPCNYFVAHDYGYHLLLEKGMTKRMRKADWGEPHDY